MQLYPFQDLEWGEKEVARLLLADHTIIGVFKFMRKQSRWKAFGDWPILHFICGMSNLLNISINKIEVMYVLKNSRETFLKNNYRNEELLNQLLSA